MPTDPPKLVALNDLIRQTVALQGELAASVNRVLASGWYILGRECTAFEEEFAAYCGVAHCVSVANGPDALEIALRSLDIGPGDSVATWPTPVATAPPPSAPLGPNRCTSISISPP